ncbi:MAG: RHS repeat-associated core domain-containing protein [Pseudomonas sp.]
MAGMDRRENGARFGYAGQLHENDAQWQFLGNGYRIYNPALMRFHSPDTMSPFGKGGINAHAYCTGDPVNCADPAGHFMVPILALMGLGALAMGSVATVKGARGDPEGAALFGAIAGGLGLAAGLFGGVRAFSSMRVAHRATATVTFKSGMGLSGEVIVRHRYAHGGISKSILIHGRQDGGGVRWGKELLDGRGLVEKLKSTGSGKAPFDYIELNTCFGAGDLAQTVADGLGKTTYAYTGVTKGGWANRVQVASQTPPRAFQPQTDVLKQAATAIRSAGRNRLAQGLRAAQNVPLR